MPSSAKYEGFELMENVMLPMGNLRFALEDILRTGASIDRPQLLRGLQAVHKNVAAIHDHLRFVGVPGCPVQPESSALSVQQDLDAPATSSDEHLEAAG